MPRTTQQTIEGQFITVIYSPSGDLEGALIEVDAAPVQLVFEHDDSVASSLFAALKPGDTVCARVEPMKPSDKGPSAHELRALTAVLKVNGKAAQKKPPRAHRGKVVRLNFARHGEPNGVVLDSGDFIHTRPTGFAKLKLKIGDSIEAKGDAWPLADGRGSVVEATRVQRIRP